MAADVLLMMLDTSFHVNLSNFVAYEKAKREYHILHFTYNA